MDELSELKRQDEELMDISDEDDAQKSKYRQFFTDINLYCFVPGNFRAAVFGECQKR